MSNNLKAKREDPLFENVKKAPVVFGVLMSISVGSYALCSPLMTKTLEFSPASALSMALMMILAVVGGLLYDKIKRATGNAVVGGIVGTAIGLCGIVWFIIECADVAHLPGFRINSALTGDSLFFIFTYVISDVFSEVFGYRASRIQGNTAAVFTIFVALCGKIMAGIPGPEWAGDNDFAFSFIYGGAIYSSIVGILIYTIGDFANDRIFRLIRKKANGSSFGQFSMRAIGSSFIGKTVDCTLFTLLVMVPFSTPSICEALGIVSWGMTPASMFGNYVLGIALQVTIETVLTPVSYFISRRVFKYIEKQDGQSSDEEAERVSVVDSAAISLNA